MLKVDLLFGTAILALWIFCVIDVIISDETTVRNLPKIAWIFIVLLFPLAGSIAWLAAGRPQVTVGRPSAYERPAPAFPEYDRPGRAAATNPDDDEAFLKQVRERAEQQREEYKRKQQEQRKAEQSGPEGETPQT